ncbi:MAG: hypothetical protein CVU87_05045 [Firmicutes bacterium HGW-Firmicutes-12]|jgi:hypothetical protein|nr:MAG: hypothetical protein CVU87_05045 [Firmicutes bacterium HGW-Firmicutes-12]
MKKWLAIIFSLLIVASMSGCTSQASVPNGKDGTDATLEIGSEERQRMDLYIEVMKAAFEEENGGHTFIAIKLDTLEELSDLAKEEVMKAFTSISVNVYDFEDIRDDNTKFEKNDKGLTRTIEGALLWVEVEEYYDRKATITGVSWFGNLGAVFPTYEATYKNGMWQLKLIRMAVS